MLYYPSFKSQAILLQLSVLDRQTGMFPQQPRAIKLHGKNNRAMAAIQVCQW
jgi:hypothetical protein